MRRTCWMCSTASFIPMFAREKERQGREHRGRRRKIGKEEGIV